MISGFVGVRRKRKNVGSSSRNVDNRIGNIAVRDRRAINTKSVVSTELNEHHTEQKVLMRSEGVQSRENLFSFNHADAILYSRSHALESISDLRFSEGMDEKQMEDAIV